MIIKPNAYLSGEINGIPSKSYLHRALFAASLSEYETIVENVIYSEDILATINILEVLGVKFIKNKHNIIVKSPAKYKEGIFNAKESGTSLRLAIPIICALGINAVFTGEGQLKKRPISEYLKIFDSQGILYEYNDTLPLSMEGKLSSGMFLIDGSVSSQYISGLLMSLPLIMGDSKISVINKFVSKSYIDMTLNILKQFGINIDILDKNSYRVYGNQKYKCSKIIIENDYSQIAFWIVGATLNGDIVIKGMNEESLQGDRKIIEIVNKMGGNVFLENNKIIVKKSQTNGIEIDAENIPDLVPILTLLASVSFGRTLIYNIRRLSEKESSRGKVIANELNKLGAKIIYSENELIIEGVKKLSSGLVYSWKDHRIAMTLALASIVASDNIAIERFDSIKKSYPSFLDDFSTLGGEVIG